MNEGVELTVVLYYTIQGLLTISLSRPDYAFSYSARLKHIPTQPHLHYVNKPPLTFLPLGTTFPSLSHPYSHCSIYVKHTTFRMAPCCTLDQQRNGTTKDDRADNAIDSHAHRAAGELHDAGAAWGALACCGGRWGKCGVGYWCGEWRLAR